MAVVIDHHHGIKPFIRTKICKLRTFTHPDFATLEFHPTYQPHYFQKTPPNVHRRSLSTPCLATTSKLEEDSNNRTQVEIVGGRVTPRIRTLVVEAAIAIASGVAPVSTPSGLGGAYYLRNRNGHNIAVVKPINREGFASIILGQPGLKRSGRAGGTGVREVAACLLDHQGFAGVPPTALVKISHSALDIDSSKTKIASMQQFVAHDFDAGDLGPSCFSVSSVHKIGILDVRLLNIDRHAGNILVKPGSHGGLGAAELVPIDHGLCLPESLDDPYFEWLHWPQALVPFSESEVEYVTGLDPFKDAEMLQRELPLLMETSIRTLVFCTIFLKRAVNAGLCLADIGDMMTREFCGAEEMPSMLESLCVQAKSSMVKIKDEETEIEQVFDMECQEGQRQTTENLVSSGLDLPRLLHSRSQMIKAPKMPLKLSSARSISGYQHKMLSLLREEKDGANQDDENDEHKVGGFTRSVSFSVMDHNHEGEGISFRGMCEQEWKSFLERFKELLPKAFECRKNMGLKQRLGTPSKY